MVPMPEEGLAAAFARDGPLRYIADDARHAPRTWRTSPPFDGLAGQLAAGAPMDHPLFPVAWPAGAPPGGSGGRGGDGE